jgi:hypothetical protein
MTSAPTRPGLADDDLAELLDLIRGADTVELKLTVPETGQRSTVEVLGMDPIDAQIRQVFFFDTPDLSLNRAGVVVRARRVQRKGDDSVVKLRPVVPTELPAKLRRSPAFGVEVDAMPGGYVCSGSLKHVLGGGEVKDAVLGRRPLRKLFSKEQRAFFSAHAPEHVELDDLSIRGLRAQARRGDVALSGRGADPRALDEVLAAGGLPDGGRDTRIPSQARRRPFGRAGDEDPPRARLLQRQAGEVGEVAGHVRR